jgi:hypothetical protein
MGKHGFPRSRSDIASDVAGAAAMDGRRGGTMSGWILPTIGESVTLGRVLGTLLVVAGLVVLGR